MFRRASELVRSRGIDSDADLGPLVDAEASEAVALEPEIHRRLQHMFDAGAWVLMESAIADLPADLRWLFESGAVTIGQLAALHAALGVTDAADLAAAVEREAIRRVPGFSAETEYAIAAALFDLRSAIPRVPLGRATSMADAITARLGEMPGIQETWPVGSLRRGQETVGDVEIMAAADDPSRAIEELGRLPDVARILHRSERRLYLRIDRVQVGLRFAEPERAGATLLHLTGSHEHLNRLRDVARQHGGRLTIDGFQFTAGGPAVAAREEDIYAALGLPFIPPEIREGRGEVEAAQQGTLPALVSRAHIRGDLHMHTTWSDGRDSVEAMAARCHGLGYEYMAITDHSPHSVASRTLSVDDVKRQGDEIAKAREQFPTLTILHGCEVDILGNGRLDMPDRVLERLDVVLASLHEAAGHSRDELLRRYLGAARHPLVHVITHPTNRILPNRPGYDLDYDRLFEAAVETGTVLEIDGAPGHLDMNGDLARRAIAAGATVSIDSDAHRAELLDRQMRLGITTARRGWVEPRHVVNARPIDALRAVLARKKQGT